MSDRIETRKWILVIALPALPFAIASVPLAWFGSREAIDWAYSLFGKDHPLNFGGNPAEVLSHLLNWILMSGCTAGLCATLIAISLLKSDVRWISRFAFVPTVIYGLTVISLLVWTGWLDSRHGEGAVVLSFVLFFGPCTILSSIAAFRLLRSRASLRVRLVHVATMFILAIIFQWFYEHSGTGGPNLLVFPLLLGQVSAWWFISRRLNSKYPDTPIEPNGRLKPKNPCRPPRPEASD